MLAAFVLCVWAGITDYHTPGGLNSKHFFLIFQEVGSPGSGVALLGSSEVPLPGLQRAVLSHRGKGATQLSGLLL